MAGNQAFAVQTKHFCWYVMYVTKTNNNWILSLRRKEHKVMRAYHCDKAVIFYPRSNDEKDKVEVEPFKLNPETEFSRAVAVAEEKKYLQIDD